jgi:hypothetical protein
VIVGQRRWGDANPAGGSAGPEGHQVARVHDVSPSGYRYCDLDLTFTCSPFRAASEPAADSRLV